MCLGGERVQCDVRSLQNTNRLLLFLKQTT